MSKMLHLKMTLQRVWEVWEVEACQVWVVMVASAVLVGDRWLCINDPRQLLTSSLTDFSKLGGGAGGMPDMGDMGDMGGEGGDEEDDDEEMPGLEDEEEAEGKGKGKEGEEPKTSAKIEEVS